MGLQDREDSAMIRLQAVQLREIHLPLLHRFETSFGSTSMRRIILLTVHSGESIGYGECTASEEPLYNSETTETAWHILSAYAIPWLLGKELEHASDAAQILSPIRGNHMARAALETALWDMEARQAGLPLHRLLGGVRQEIPCGVSIGIQESIEALLAKVRQEVSEGYRRVKIKIKPGWDIEPLRAIRSEYPELPLMVDANSAFQMTDLPLLQRLDEFGLMMIEQPLAHDDIVDHAALQKQIQTPICLDESIGSAEDARKAVELGSCRIINVKLGRVGGYAEARRINDYCTRHGVPLWCGGMLESGIGRAHNIAMSTLSGFTLPGDVSASKRYYAEDTVRPPVTVTPRGTILVPDSPGIGFTPDSERIERATVRSCRLSLE
jgi:O-succinylbenzoate synthase